MGPRFNNPKLLRNGKLQVSGPFETHGRVLDDVVVRFLIIDESRRPVFGTATIGKRQLQFAPNLPLDPDDPDLGITSGTFKATVAPNRGLHAGEKVRAIGVSVAVKNALRDPPAIETFTWCVTVEVV
jgi:hypothetical protein